MPGFLSGLFGAAEDDLSGLSPALIDAAIERAVDGTDPRLRALGGYRRRLRGPASKAIRHVIGLIDDLPPAAPITPGYFGQDPRLRAFFVSPKHINEVLGRFWTVRDYLAGAKHPLPDDIFGLLSVAQYERSTLGMELDGDMLKRDVLQTAVTFSDHQYLAPAASERRTRRELKRRAFDFLVQTAREQMLKVKTSRGDMARRRQALRGKLDAINSGRWGGEAVGEAGDAPSPGLAEMEAEIAAIDAELGRFGKIDLSLEESLRHVEETLAEADRWLTLRPACLCLDYRGIKREAATASPQGTVAITEVTSASGFHRIVMLARIPRAELPGPVDAVKRGQAFLG